MGLRGNRKKQDEKGGLMAGFILIVGAVVLVGLAYVWIVSACETVGRDLRALEKERDVLAKQFANEEYRWTRMKAPLNLERAIEQHGLAMALPRLDQVIRLSEQGPLPVNVVASRGGPGRGPN